MWYSARGLPTLECQMRVPAVPSMQVDGESGHRVSIEQSVVHAIVSPCSARSNNITVQLIQQVTGIPRGLQ